MFEVWPAHVQRLRGARGTGPRQRGPCRPLPMPRGEGNQTRGRYRRARGRERTTFVVSRPLRWMIGPRARSSPAAWWS